MVDTDIVLYRASTNISKSHGLTLHQKWLQKFQQTKFFINEVKQIIEIINIKESTLRYHKQNIDGKLGVHSLKQLLQYAASMKEAKEEPDAL